MFFAFLCLSNLLKKFAKDPHDVVSFAHRIEMYDGDAFSDQFAALCDGPLDADLADSGVVLAALHLADQCVGNVHVEDLRQHRELGL